VDHNFGSSDFKSGTSFEACYPSFQLTTNQHVALCQYHRDAESCFPANVVSKNWYHVTWQHFDTRGRPLVSRTYMDYPWSPRWDAPQMAQRIMYALKTLLACRKLL
jgi:hypothetical protein